MQINSSWKDGKDVATWTAIAFAETGSGVPARCFQNQNIGCKNLSQRFLTKTS
jgi:hypothetical protein